MKKVKKSTLFAFGMGDFGYNFINTMIASFLTLYYTDSVGLSAAFAGTMMLVCRLLDGVSDIAMGMIIEKTNSKWGKARPWFALSLIPFAISGIMLFMVPSSLSTGGKQIWAYVTYILVTVVFATMLGLSYNTLLSRFTSDPQQRNQASAIRMALDVIVILGVGILTTPLIGNFGGLKMQSAWTKVIIIYAVLGLISSGICAVFVKEQVEPEEMAEKTTESASGLIKTLFSNKYTYIILFTAILIYSHAGFMGLGVYYAKDVLGDANLVGPMNILLMAPVFLAQFFIPTLCQKVGKRMTCIFGAISVIISSCIFFVQPYNMIAVMVAFFLRGVGFAPLMGLIPTFPADLIDFISVKSGKHLNGYAYMLNTIGQKIGNGLGAAMVGWGLAWGLYNGQLSEQSATTVSYITKMMGTGYLIMGIGILLCMVFWTMEKDMKEMKESR